eukprot:gene41111-55582_t
MHIEAMTMVRSGSSAPERRRGMSEHATKRKSSDAESDAALRRIAAISEDEIDTSDIPEITEAQWHTAQKGRHFRPYKTAITIRLDADVVDWFKARSENGGYQTEINRVLRQHMLEAIKSAG